MTATISETATTTTETVAPHVEFPAAALRDALAACLLSAGKDKTLPILMAIKVERRGDELVVTSTDRYRLTRVAITLSTDLEQRGDETWAVLVSGDDAKRWVATLKDEARGFGRAPAWLTIEGDDVTLGTYSGMSKVRGVEGDYPRVDSIIPETASKGAGLPSIAFNPKYMIDLCKMPGRGKNAPVVMDFQERASAPMVSRWNDGDVSYVHVIMPVRVPETR